MSVLDDYQKLTRQVESLKRKRDKALGARDQLLQRLKKEFKVKTLEEAKRLLEKFLDAEIKASEEYVKLSKEFKKKWKAELEGLEKEGE